MKPITFNNQEYDILIQDGGIILQGLHQDIEMPGEYEALESDIKQRYGYYEGHIDKDMLGLLVDDEIVYHIENLLQDGQYSITKWDLN